MSASRSRSRSRSPDSRDRSASRSPRRGRQNGDASDEDRRSKSKSPVRDRSPVRSRSRSPSKERSPRGRSASPARSRSPDRGRSYSRSKSPEDDKRSPSRERSRDRSHKRERSLDADRSRSKSRERSPSKERSRSHRRRDSRERSRDRSRRSRSRSRGRGRDWKRKLERLIERGHIRQSDIDSYAMQQLERMNPDEAACVIDRFGEARFTRIGSKAGFLMGIIRRVQQEGPDGGRGDLHQLPRAVRHRLEDLIDRRQVNRDELDKRMVNTLAGLSANDALTAVQRFSDTPLDNIRNKTAYMMSLIRRIQGPMARHDDRGRR